MDTFFLSHGGPTLCVDETIPAWSFFKSWLPAAVAGAQPPRTILVVSAHWETAMSAVNVVFPASTTPSTTSTGFPSPCTRSALSFRMDVDTPLRFSFPFGKIIYDDLFTHLRMQKVLTPIVQNATTFFIHIPSIKWKHLSCIRVEASVCILEIFISIHIVIVSISC
uniref:Extradiol ring-cleavage dioxygenase class III enzyme subunit B domain-containing protein n=1 Tax=Triticum aestivum TaxID=4565 RepID=A0A077RRZ2_WHEAT|nr:unnamed protein product [Triticum aestivum]CDM80755.1 unnamed protein product [Triticum aestivum]